MRRFHFFTYKAGIGRLAYGDHILRLPHCRLAVLAHGCKSFSFLCIYHNAVRLHEHTVLDWGHLDDVHPLGHRGRVYSAAGVPPTPDLVGIAASAFICVAGTLVTVEEIVQAYQWSMRKTACVC